MPPIDPDRLRLTGQSASTGGRKTLNKSPPRPVAGKHFLKGPIPLDWLATAARLPGRSLHAGIALWYVAGLTKSCSVPLTNINSQRFGLDRNAKYRALDWMEEAGLIAVDRQLGRSPIVTLLDADGE